MEQKHAILKAEREKIEAFETRCYGDDEHGKFLAQRKLKTISYTNEQKKIRKTIGRKGGRN